MRQAELRQHQEPVDPEWYWPVGAAAFAVALAGGVTAQRGGLLSPNVDALWAWVATLPWLFDAVAFPIKRIGVPVWLFTIIVVGATVAIETDPVDVDLAPFFLVLLSGEMGMRLRSRDSVAVMLVLMSTMLGIEIWGSYDESWVWLLAIALSWVCGVGMQMQLLLLAKTRDEQIGLAERAAAQERQRIAREIHDVVAHTLSVSMLYVTGARLALRRDPDEAEEALLAAERMGRESLAEIRRTVGLLAPETGGAEPPMPTAADVRELVDEYRAAGLDVELDIVGDTDTLPAAMGLALYRIVQESLTNVAKHAPSAHAAVRLSVDPNHAALRVTNVMGTAPRANGVGLGVQGMRERVELLGGTFRAGTDDGEWTVQVDIPRSTGTCRWRA